MAYRQWQPRESEHRSDDHHRTWQQTSHPSSERNASHYYEERSWEEGSGQNYDSTRSYGQQASQTWGEETPRESDRYRARDDLDRDVQFEHGTNVRSGGYNDYRATSFHSAPTPPYYDPPTPSYSVPHQFYDGVPLSYCLAGKYVGTWQSSYRPDKISGSAHIRVEGNAEKATAALEYTGDYLTGLKRTLDFTNECGGGGQSLPKLVHRPDSGRDAVLGDQTVTLLTQSIDTETGELRGMYTTSIPADTGKFVVVPQDFDEAEAFTNRTPFGVIVKGAVSGFCKALGL